MARSKHKNATTLHQLRDDIAAVCRSEGIYDPARWLTVLMAGKDPRNIHAGLAEMILKIARDYLDGNRETMLPDESEMESIVREASRDIYKNAPVSLDLSTKAAIELMKYIHRNLVEIKAEAVAQKRNIAPITKQEIRDFLDVFDERY